MLSVPGFHHLHLNSTDPEAAMAFYTRQFPSTAKTSWGGLPALQSPNNVLILFTQVSTAPATSPQTAIWHFGWPVTDSRARLEEYKSRPKVTLVPLYTGDDGGAVFVSSDTWPGTGGVLGLTKAQIADAKARGVQPTRTGGFAYMQGPDNALVEYAGNHPTERFNHVHLFQEDPFCAQLWYQQHLNAPVFAGRTSSTPLTEATCKVERGPDRTFPALDPEGMCRTPPAAAVGGGRRAYRHGMRQKGPAQGFGALPLGGSPARPPPVASPCPWCVRCMQGSSRALCMGSVGTLPRNRLKNN